jgi:hypothetical protein
LDIVENVQRFALPLKVFSDFITDHKKRPNLLEATGVGLSTLDNNATTLHCEMMTLSKHIHQNDSHKNKTHRYSDYPEPTMMLLMGMKMSLTKYPTKPITTKPSAVLIDTFENSVHQATSDNIKTTLIH